MNSSMDLWLIHAAVTQNCFALPFKESNVFHLRNFFAGLPVGIAEFLADLIFDQMFFNDLFHVLRLQLAVE